MKLPHQSTPNPLDARDVAPLGFTKGDYAFIGLAASYSTNMTVGNHVEFNQIIRRGTSISLAIGSGQANGLITLGPNRTYLIRNWIYCGVNEGGMGFRWTVNSHGGPVVGDTGVSALVNRVFDQVGTVFSKNHEGGLLFTPLAETVIDLRIIESTNPTAIRQQTRVWIREII